MRFIFIFLVSGWLAASESVLILNRPNTSVLPPSFRKESSPLYASASGQFSEEGLKLLLNEIPADSILVVDLREEFHGYLNGNAVSWYAPRNWANASMDPTTIEEKEALILYSLQNQLVSIYPSIEKTTSYPIIPGERFAIQVDKVQTERQLCNGLGIQYFRLPVRDHVYPSDLQVDNFLKLLYFLPDNVWIHFHCSRGRGRATTLLVMYDIIKHGKELSLEEIIDRQWQAGGKNLAHISPPYSWKYTLSQDRLKFIETFYRYNQSNTNKSWSEWKKSTL